MTRTAFVIEDSVHFDIFREFSHRTDAMAELERLATLMWDAEENVAPCNEWKTCGRSYELVEYDTSAGEPWRELSRNAMLEISARKVRWH